MLGLTCHAQEQLAEQQPGTLFAYPLAPDTCSTLEERCNYIITHFWDNYDISKPISDDAAFETTFRDFVDFFRFAHRNVVLNAVRDLVNKAQSNASNLQKIEPCLAPRPSTGATRYLWLLPNRWRDPSSCPVTCATTMLNCWVASMPSRWAQRLTLSMLALMV